jgi:hypothetical protein
MAQSTIPVKQLPITTEVGDPGNDTVIPTEQAVREAIADIVAPTPIISSSTKLFLYYNCY